MSKRKRYRALRNKAIKDNQKEFAKHRRAQRDEREAAEAHEQLGRVRLIYEEWKVMLVEEAKKHPRGLSAPQIITAVEVLKDSVRKVIKDKYTLQSVLSEVGFNEVKFIAAYGPKSEAQKAEWRAEAKRLRTSNRKPPEPPPVNPVNN